MADITMCSGEWCPKKDACYRYTATANEYRQSYFCEAPVKAGECEYFSPNESYEKK